MNSVIENYKKTVAESNYIRHALGAFDGHIYLNTIEAADFWYEKGSRLFEVDVRITSDGVPVLSHGWNKSGLPKDFPFPFDTEKSSITHEEFKKSLLWGKYKASDIHELADFLEKHQDAYIMIDIGRANYTETKKIYRAIVREVNNNSILSRFIVGGHTTDAIMAVKETYDFSLYNLYYARDNIREDVIKTPYQFIRFCDENHISSFSIAAERFTDWLAEQFKNAALISYLFTIDKNNEAGWYRVRGASVIGTNTLE